MILLIDNYDSFVYNLARYIEELGAKTQVVRNDAITIEEIAKLDISHIVLSPGPCSPDQAGISLKVIKEFSGIIPILGVCLGHQAIGQAYGGKVVRASKPMHGRSSIIEHDGTFIFSGLPNPLKVGRYHSLVVDTQEFPNDLIITAKSDDGHIMGIRHRFKNVYGVQFHPESIITEYGYHILNNFIMNKYE